jgi:hypothetical protein
MTARCRMPCSLIRPCKVAGQGSSMLCDMHMRLQQSLVAYMCTETGTADGGWQPSRDVQGQVAKSGCAAHAAGTATMRMWRPALP